MNNYKGLKVFARLMKYVWVKWYLFLLGISTIVIMSYSNSIIPMLIREAIDEGIMVRSLDRTIYFSLLILLASAVFGLANFISRYIVMKISQDTVYKIRIEAFKSIQLQSMDFFDKTMVGQLISRTTNDTERITGFLGMRLRMMVYSLLITGISLYYMFTMNTYLTLIALTTLSLSLIFNAKYALIIRPLYDQIRNQTGVLAGIASSNLSGIKTVKALAIEDVGYGKFVGENDKFLDLNVKAYKIRAIYGNFSMLLIALAMASILYFGGYFIINDIITVGELTAFVTYMVTLTWPLRMLGFSIDDVQRAVAAASRLFEIIDAEPPVRDRPDAIELEDVRGEIVFENVSFSYAHGKKALKNINLHVRPREKVVIIGPPGSGKSTLLKLLVRFYELDNGRILVDGVDIRDVKLKSLRKRIAYVPQEPFIFNRSIRENIQLGNPSASIEDIVKAAEIAKIHDFIMSLPEGYETIVGERGITLSGGQRQRIALARALVSNPKIILLDDPVSNLDAETEELLVRDLEEILRDKTVLIVTQRLSLVRLADRIVVMDKGEIVEVGSHEELLEKGGLYFKLYQSMMSGRDVR